MSRLADVLIRNNGSTISFDFLTKRGRSWLRANRNRFEAWQFMGSFTVVLDSRVACSLRDDLENDGIGSRA